MGLRQRSYLGEESIKANAASRLKKLAREHPEWSKSQLLYNAGWRTRSDGWVCAKCGTSIGANLRNEKPFLLAKQHAEGHYKRRR